MRYKGKLVQWYDERGYGLIAPEDGAMQLFVHISAFPNPRVRPKRGEWLTYELGEDERGRPKAERVLPPGVKPRPAWRERPLLVSATLSLGWFLVLGGAVLGGWTPPWVLWLYLFASAFSLFLYAWDKRAAQRDDWRTPEKTLHLLALAGGWPGALVAQPLFRHKTRKLSFLVLFWATVVLNCAALIGLHTAQGRSLLASPELRAVIGAPTPPKR